MNKLAVTVREEFIHHFKNEPVMVKSPGRINLIGEHTDYNRGFVLPAAIDKVITVAIAPNRGGAINLAAIDKSESYHHDLTEPFKRTRKGWPDYIIGVVDQLQKAGYSIEGFDCAFGGDIPIGAGLSSSAALEGGIIYGLSTIFDLEVSKHDMALLAQKAENNFVGVQCGIMDQFVNIHGVDGHALKLDCRSMEYQLYPFDQENIHIVLCDTNIRRELASSEYNNRRRQCEQGVERLNQYDDSIDSLRDVSRSLLEEHRDTLGPVIYNRCKFVLEENRRVLESCDDLINDDIHSFGQKMYASHVGLKDLYEVSCNELDVLVEEALRIEGVIGCRMMGGGFGGCTINLVEKSSLDSFTGVIRSRYRKKTGRDIDLYLTRIGGGVELLETGRKERLKQS